MVPLVLGSRKQQLSLQWAVLAFAKAHLGKHRSKSPEARTLLAHSASSSHMVAGVEIGRTNLNLNDSRILWPSREQSANVSAVIRVSKGCKVSSIHEHAVEQYPAFVDQVSKYGLPPVYTDLLEGRTIPVGSLRQTTSPLEEDVTVIQLPKRPGPRTIQIPLNAFAGQEVFDLQLNGNATIQFDVARRSNCFLGALGKTQTASSSQETLRSAKNCSGQEVLQIQSQVLATVGEDCYAITKPTVTPLKSRFSLEWGPDLASTHPNAEGTINFALSPIAWETVVLEMNTTPQLKQQYVTVANNQAARGAIVLRIELPADAVPSNVMEENPDESHSYDLLYIGVVRETREKQR